MQTANSSILIVEDSETQAVLLSSILEEQGWKTEWSASAEAALELLMGQNYNLVIVDYHLPGMNGDQLCRQIKMNIHTRSMPVFMLTIEGSSESEKHALESGADAFAPKEMDKELLVARIRSLLTRSQSDNILKKDMAPFQRSRILAVDDSPTFLTFLEESFKADGMVIDKADSGQKALQMARKKDYDCILLDLVMPEMDGIAVCREISKLKLTDQKLSVVMMLTAHEGKQEMMHALEAGADDFVGKSNDISIIKSRLAALLRRRFIQLDNQKIWKEFKEKELEAERERIEKEAAQAKVQLTEQLQETVVKLEQEIKERERISNELMKAKEDAEKANKTKSEFLSNMSHELRSPLNSMLILSHHLMQNSTGNLTEKQVQSARIINESGNDLLIMIYMMR